MTGGSVQLMPREVPLRGNVPSDYQAVREIKAVDRLHHRDRYVGGVRDALQVLRASAYDVGPPLRVRFGVARRQYVDELDDDACVGRRA